MDARKVYAVCRRGFVGGWSEGESDGEKWWGVNSVQSEKQSGFPGVGWVISAALDDWDEKLSFPVACRERMGRGASPSTWR